VKIVVSAGKLFHKLMTLLPKMFCLTLVLHRGLFKSHYSRADVVEFLG